MRKRFQLNHIVLVLPFFLSACFDQNASKCDSLFNNENKQTLATTYCENAAKKGDATSQVNFAKLLLAQGDAQRAVDFLEKAANQKNGSALFMLAQFYEKGEAVEKDQEKAFFYYQQSCQANEMKGCERENSLKLVQQKQRQAEQIELEKAKAATLAQEKAKLEIQAKAKELERLAEEAKAKRQEMAALKAKVGNRKFYYGLAKYQEGNLWGHINPKGEIVIPLQFAYAADFYEGLAAVKTSEGKWGYIDLTGQYQIQPMFSCVYYFNEGLAAVGILGYGKNCQGAKWGFIDKQGNWVIKPVLDHATPFKNGIAKVIYQGQTGYINKQGQWINY